MLQSAWLSLFQTTTPAEVGWTIDLDVADDIFVAFLGRTGKPFLVVKN